MNSSSPSVSSQTFIRNSTWMSRLDPTLKLTEIAIPGAHDAGTYDINCQSPWNPHRTGEASRWARVAKYIAPWITSNYAKTQNLDLIDQFRQGVRYWDLRVAKYQESPDKPVQYRFTHGLLGSDFIKGVVDLINYSKYFPQEILLLDVRFVFGFAAEDHDMLQQRLMNVAGSRLADHGTFGPISTLEEFWSKRANIIIVYSAHSSVPVRRNPAFWPKNTRLEFWPNSHDVDKAMTLLDQYLQQNQEREDAISLSVLQATLTPNGEYIAWHLFGSVQKLTIQLNERIITPIGTNWRGKINYIMYDVVEYPGLANAIIQSNFADDN